MYEIIIRFINKYYMRTLFTLSFSEEHNKNLKNFCCVVTEKIKSFNAAYSLRFIRLFNS